MPSPKRDQQAQDDGLHGRDRRVIRDPSRRCAARPWLSSNSERPQPNRKRQRQHRLRNAHRRNSIRPQPPDPGHIDNGEQRLQHHLQHHRNREQQNGPVQASGGVVLMRTAQGFADGGPESALGLGLGWNIHGSEKCTRGTEQANLGQAVVTGSPWASCRNGR
jgi:hypothetical protein